MFKISITENSVERRLVLEGMLVSPWTSELENVWHEAQASADGRKLVIDLSDVTRISAEGEQVLTRLIEDGAKMACGGIFNRHLLKQLRRQCHCKR